MAGWRTKTSFSFARVADIVNEFNHLSIYVLSIKHTGYHDNVKNLHLHKTICIIINNVKEENYNCHISTAILNVKFNTHNVNIADTLHLRFIELSILTTTQNKMFWKLKNVISVSIKSEAQIINNTISGSCSNKYRKYSV